MARKSRFYAIVAFFAIVLLILFMRSSSSEAQIRQVFNEIPRMAGKLEKETQSLVKQLEEQASLGNEIVPHVLKDPILALPPTKQPTQTQQTQIAIALEGTEMAAGQGQAHLSPSSRPVSDQRQQRVFSAKEKLKDLLESYEVIIFSKSYCPHSRRAKTILDRYAISPIPLVFELDIEDHGSEIQAALYDLTRRRTVPNIMVGKESVGGGDTIAELEETDQLIPTFRKFSKAIDISKKR